MLFIRYRLILCFTILFGINACAKAEDGGLRGDKNGVFEDVTEGAKLNFINASYSHCWGDINGDGLLDIFIINHASPSLFRGNGDGTFKDITLESGIIRWGDLHGCAIGDYDNDGDQDIYVTVGARRGKGSGSNRLYKNNGEGMFNDVASEAGVTDPKGRGRSASWVDYNNDGYLDLFMSNGKRKDASSVLFKNNGDGSFSNVSVESKLNIVDNLTEASWVDYDNDGFMDLTTVSFRRFRKWEIDIYKNSQNGTFEKTKTFYGWTYAWGDYDNDGDLDLFISKPPRVYILGYEFSVLSKLFRGFNKLYENIGKGRFIDISDKAGFKKEMGGDKAVFFDYDNDGDLDIYLLVSGTKSKNINDMIFKNNGDKTFTNITKEIALTQNFKGRGCGVAYADYNNDGFLDLFLTNGRYNYRARNEIKSHSAGPYVLYKNKYNNNHWLKIRLIGTKSNRDGIGAQIKLYLGDRVQYRQNTGGMDGYVQHSNMIHFGLGNLKSIDKIEVKWPSGSVSNMTNIKSNQTLVIREE
jgi:hypothetical protein